MKPHTYAYLAIQYHHPESFGLDGRPRYVVFEGVGKDIKSDLVWQPTAATKFDDTTQGYCWALNALREFCDHTELESKYCAIVRVAVDVAEASVPTIEPGRTYRSRKPTRMDGAHTELTVVRLNPTHVICHNQYGHESSHALSTFHDKWELKG